MYTKLNYAGWLRLQRNLPTNFNSIPQQENS